MVKKEVYLKTLNLKNNNSYLNFVIKELYCELGSFNNAEFFLKKCIEKHPASDYHQYLLGIIQNKKGCYEKAIDIFNKSLETQKNNYKIYVGRAESYWNVGKINESLDDLNKAMRIKKFNLKIMLKKFNLEFRLLMTQFIDNNLAYFERIIKKLLEKNIIINNLPKNFIEKKDVTTDPSILQQDYKNYSTKTNVLSNNNEDITSEQSHSRIEKKIKVLNLIENRIEYDNGERSKVFSGHPWDLFKYVLIKNKEFDKKRIPYWWYELFAVCPDSNPKDNNYRKSFISKNSKMKKKIIDMFMSDYFEIYQSKRDEYLDHWTLNMKKDPEMILKYIPDVLEFKKLFTKGISCFKDRQYNDVIETCQKALKIFPNDLDTQVLYIKALKNLDNDSQKNCNWELFNNVRNSILSKAKNINNILRNNYNGMKWRGEAEVFIKKLNARLKLIVNLLNSLQKINKNKLAAINSLLESIDNIEFKELSKSKIVRELLSQKFEFKKIFNETVQNSSNIYPELPKKIIRKRCLDSFVLTVKHIKRSYENLDDVYKDVKYSLQSLCEHLIEKSQTINDTLTINTIGQEFNDNIVYKSFYSPNRDDFDKADKRIDENLRDQIE